MTTKTQDKLGFVAVAKATLLRFKAHNVMVIAAGIAFFGFLALIPTMIATMSIFGLVADASQIPEMVDNANGLDEDTKSFLVTQLQTMTESKGLGLATGLGIFLALFSASGAVQKLMNTISLAYATIENRKGFKVRGLAFLFTIGAILGFVALILAVGVLPTLAGRIDGLSGPTSALIQIAVYPIIIGVIYFGLTVLYRYGPDRGGKRTTWKNTGALVGTLLFLFFAIALSTYSRLAGGMPASYAILGVFASIMVFLQLAAISVVIGAEINAVLEKEPIGPIGANTDLYQPPREIDNSTFPLVKALVGFAAIFLLGGRD